MGSEKYSLKIFDEDHRWLYLNNVWFHRFIDGWLPTILDMVVAWAREKQREHDDKVRELKEAGMPPPTTETEVTDA